MNDTETASHETETTTVPGPDAAPDVGVAPFYAPTLNNLAGDDALTAQVWTWCKKQWTRYEGQSQRTNFCGDGKTMDVADRIWRVALNRDTASAQHKETLSDVASTCGFNACRAIVGSLNRIFFFGRELPAVYEREVNTKEYTPDMGDKIAQQHNALEQLTWDEDHRTQKVRDIHQWVTVYSNQMVGMEWLRRVETRPVRKPGWYAADGTPVPAGPGESVFPDGAFMADGTPAMGTLTDEDGVPRSFVWTEDEVVTADWPSLSIYDMKDCWFDAQVDDMDQQQCILIQQQRDLSDLYAEQRAGCLMNVDTLTEAQLYVGEETSTLENRSTNAGDDATPEPTGLYSIWHVKARLPIRENKGRVSGTWTGKGKWDPAKTAPARYWATFAGRMNGDVKCLRLIREPNPTGGCGMKLLHSHPDNKGAYHAGVIDRIIPLYWQIVTNVNQTIDGNTKANNAPLVTDGPVKRRDLTFRQNDIIKIGAGTKLTVLQIPQVANTIELHDRFVDDVQRTAGADKPITGEMAFARTSATQSKLVHDQAFVPIDELADYLADQLYPWMLENDAAYWRSRGNPVAVQSVSNMNEIQQINPGNLWGPLKTKVVAVTRFRNDTVRRQELNNLMSNVLPMFAPYMGQDGMKEIGRDIFELFGLEKAHRYFPNSGHYDAEARAMNAIYQMTVNGKWVEPVEGENQTVWIELLEAALNEYKNLPEQDQNQEALRMLRLQIETRRNILQRQTSGSMMRPGQMPGQGPAPVEGQALGGEIIGDRMEAEMGAQSGGG